MPLSQSETLSALALALWPISARGGLFGWMLWHRLRLPHPPAAVAGCLSPCGAGCGGGRRRCSCSLHTAWTPPEPLPPPLLGTFEDCPFAHDTITNRLPNAILTRTVELNVAALDAASRRNLDTLQRTLADGDAALLALPADGGGGDIEQWWAAHAAPLLGGSWAAAPWFTSETLAYRHVLAATGFFDAASPLHAFDIFGHEKWQGLRAALPRLREMVAQHEEVAAAAAAGRPGNFEVLTSLIHMSLWGNQADSSLWAAGAHPDLEEHAQQGEAGAAGSRPPGDQRLLVDDSAAACAALLAGPGGGVVVVVCDNSGMELVCDLLLARWLLARGHASHVELVVKPAPFYVSDATAPDVDLTLAALTQDPSTALGRLGRDCLRHMVTGKLSVRPDAFWSSPLAAWEMPAARRAALAAARLVVVKGDLQYRKLLGNRRWPHATPFADVVRGFPAPLLSCRTLKAPLVVGLSDGAVAALDATDAEWRVNGTRGTVHFAPAPPPLGGITSSRKVRVRRGE